MYRVLLKAGILKFDLEYQEFKILFETLLVLNILLDHSVFFTEYTSNVWLISNKGEILKNSL